MVVSQQEARAAMTVCTRLVWFELAWQADRFSLHDITECTGVTGDAVLVCSSAGV